MSLLSLRANHPEREGEVTERGPISSKRRKFLPKQVEKKKGPTSHFIWEKTRPISEEGERRESRSRSQKGEKTTTA